MRLRQVGWIIAIYITIYYAFIIFTAEHNTLRYLVSSFFPLIGGTIGLRWVWLAYRESDNRVDRVFWKWIMAGLVLYILSQITWLFSQIYIDIGYYPLISHVLWLLTYICFLGGLIFLLYKLQKAIGKVRFYFNVGIFMTAAIAVSVHYLIQPIIWTFDTAVVTVTQLAHPIVDLAILFIILRIYQLTAPKDRRLWFSLFIAAFVLQIISDTAYVVLYMNTQYQSGNIIDPFWLLSIMIIGYAGLLHKHNSGSSEWHAKDHTHGENGYTPFATVLVLIVFYVYEGGFQWSTLGAGLILVFLLVLVRQAFVLRENRYLIKEYRIKAFQDPLTSLNNRNQFQYDMTRFMEKAEQLNLNVAIFMIDLDRFKEVNDSLGHDAGDLLLNKVASRIEQGAGEQNKLYRIGGDEFVMLLPNSSKSYCVLAAQGIMARFVDPITVEDHEISVRLSIGISIYPEHGQTGDLLLKHADAAMFAAKNQRGTHIQFYDEKLRLELIRKFKLESGLGQAIVKNGLYMVYQPKVILDTREVIGMEALLRWEHPELGPVSPGEFIPVAEETGQIIPLGEWALEEVCRQNKAWQDAGYPELCISVNVSVRQFQHSEFLPSIRRILKETELDPKFLELEITESIMQNIDASRKILDQLHVLGVKVSIDDFGTGYSSLFVLENLPIDTIKVDKVFIDDLSSSKKYLLVKSIIDIGLNLNLDVVVEGVENEQQVQLLIDAKAVIGQGYLFGKPMSAKTIENMLE